MSPVLTYQQAIARALDWAEGRLSHNNTMLTAERDPEQRAVTLALIEFADAQEVVKWSSLAMALIAGDVASLTDERDSLISENIELGGPLAYEEQS